ncbi:carbohydrate-binding module family 52 protein [Diplogelasinospora grovesii]|uniref:Carbohydrate-binding module family 52 protein n=1 Tax=Diplogelasinospora grovesii TaxID=303347 RepID=A0AAN6NF53_9PEZI|nr:carbohydrate-binding module family 52 protein [Diplogelasinospora grovesii]
MARLSLIAIALMGLGETALAALQSCGNAQYDPSQYVCWYNQFLCPVVAGEGLSYCSGACYSTFMYTCSNNVLTLLPAMDSSTPFTLTASNPNLPAVDGKPITASGQHWSIGGVTGSYCPTQVGSACPKGDITAIVSSGGSAAMDVEVPGGQLVYLDPFWNVGYTQAHSASIPSGSITTGFGAYQGGGFVNLNGNGWGWVACPPTAAGGGGGVWNLVAKNSTNAASLSGCTALNLKINPLPQGTIGAWQYT